MGRRRLWLVGIVVILAAYVVYLWVSWPDWDRSPQSRIISFEPGLAEIDYNYIPDFQVWGDGRIVWVEYALDHSRRVLEGRLSPAQLNDIMERFFIVGFFNPLNDFQESRGGRSLRITLRNSQTTREIGADHTLFFALANYLRNGAGAAGKDYVPLRGDFYVFLASDVKDLPKTAKPQYQWPDQKFKYTLESVYHHKGQFEITGDELAFAWKVVNARMPLVESNGVVYWIAIIVPGISE